MWNDLPVEIVADGCMAKGVVEEVVECESSRGFLASVQEAIETLSCGEDYPTVRATAELVGVSVRTLQRRLARAGASHQLLVAQARFATAAVVLEQSDAKILELALDLGYSDHANFTRAFRRWAGCAPREYRSSNFRPMEFLAAQRFAGGEIAPAERRAREEEA